MSQSFFNLANKNTHKKKPTIYLNFLFSESKENRNIMFVSTLKHLLVQLQSFHHVYIQQLSSSKMSGCSSQNKSPIISQLWAVTFLLLRVKVTSFSPSLGNVILLVDVSSTCKVFMFNFKKKKTIIKLMQSNKLQINKLSIIATYFFPDQCGAFSVQRWFIVVIHIKLWKQHFILICRQSSLKQHKENIKRCTVCVPLMIYQLILPHFTSNTMNCEVNTNSNFKFKLRWRHLQQQTKYYTNWLSCKSYI